MKLNYRKLIAVCAGLALSAAAEAQIFIATGASGAITKFTFTINDALNQVSVQVDNNLGNVSAVKGIVTSFGFNVPTGVTGSLLSVTGVPVPPGNPDPFVYYSPFDFNPQDPYKQDVGASNGNSPQQGSTATGVQNNSSATFVFQFSNFSLPVAGFFDNTVTVKWQGLISSDPVWNTKSDHVLAVLTPPGGPSDTPVPEPSTYGLFGAAVLVIGVSIRRFIGKSKVA